MQIGGESRWKRQRLCEPWRLFRGVASSQETKQENPREGDWFSDAARLASPRPSAGGGESTAASSQPSAQRTFGPIGGPSCMGLVN